MQSEMESFLRCGWQVGDDTCVQLASLVWHQVKAVEAWRKGGRNFWHQKSAPFFFQCQEIHLSHNEVQQKGEKPQICLPLLLVEKNQNTLKKSVKKNTT